jgi:diamine N-acetyltransferase
MTDADHHSDLAVSLRPITAETVLDIVKLRVGPDQEQFVAPNAVSLAQALFSPTAWYRAIYAAASPVGFVMLDDDPSQHTYFLWRFMIAAEHQGRGYGRRALGLVVEYVRSRPGAVELRTSYVPGEGSPGPFYHRLGFEDTGEVDDGERVLRLPLP